MCKYWRALAIPMIYSKEAHVSTRTHEGTGTYNGEITIWILIRRNSKIFPSIAVGVPRHNRHDRVVTVSPDADQWKHIDMV